MPTPPPLKTGQGTLVVRTYAALDSYLQGFLARRFGLMVLIGACGTGKSQIVRQVTGESTCWIEHGATTYALYKLFYKYQDKPVVLDDLDCLYTNKNSISLLKNICQSRPTKTVAWNARNGFLKHEGLPESFETSSPVMIIANDWRTVTKNVGALEDRGQVIHFEPTPREIHTQAGTWFDDPEIYEWYEGQVDRLKKHSLRNYIKAAQLKACGIPWRTVFAATATIEGREILARELITDPKYLGNEERAREFVRRGGGSRGTFFAYRRKILGIVSPDEEAEASPEIQAFPGQAPEPQVKRGRGRPRKVDSGI